MLSLLLAAGCFALAVGHSGVEVPLISRLGPGGGRAVPPAAVAFSVATIVLLVVGAGLWRRRSWAWPLGIVVHGLIAIGAAFPFRGWGSVIGIAVAVASLALLLSRGVREHLLGRSDVAVDS